MIKVGRFKLKWIKSSVISRTISCRYFVNFVCLTLVSYNQLGILLKKAMMAGWLGLTPVFNIITVIYWRPGVHEGRCQY